MSQPYLTLKSHVLLLIKDQIDQVKHKNALKLNNYVLKIPDISLSEVIECVHEFLYSYQPPLELERLSLQNNQLESLPINFSIISNNIRYLDLHNNRFRHISEALTDMPNLEILDLSSNMLFNLPASGFSKLKNLRIISLKENKFSYLPPVLGELPSLSLIEVADNPLLVPSPETIRSFQLHAPDLEWVHELKNYLLTNRSTIQAKLNEQAEHLGDRTHEPPASLLRSKSITDNRTKASKAARRMGLIIKKPQDVISGSGKEDSSHGVNNGSLLSHQINHDSPSTTDTHASFFGAPAPHPQSASASQTSFVMRTPPLPPVSTTTTSTTSKSLSSSLQPSPSNSPVPFQPTGRMLPSNRSRSNTLKELDRILEKNDNVDTEHKSGAYFRRLSTLQELPLDENSTMSINIIPTISGSNSSSNTSSRQSSVGHVQKFTAHQQMSDATSESSHHNRLLHESNHPLSGPFTITKADISPGKIHSEHKDNSLHRTAISSVALIKASRKILFLFSELHSSVRRFSGFCADKRITIKMVSLLYTSKSNIDSLVENLELMEEDDNNSGQIYSSIHTCISSFKSMMNLLSENLSAFVLKTDICFIRMLYLTLYGSFNELSNAYKIVVPNAARVVPTFSTSNGISATTLDPKHAASKQQLSVNTDIDKDNEAIDEKLYRSIEIATTNAQVVFAELNKAIGKTAIASASNSISGSAQQVSHAVATRVKELMNVCVTSMDITKRLKTKLITIRNSPSQTTRKLFYDDINSFLKAIIQTFSSVKSVMKDIPVLNDVRSHMASLTKATKDVTILLEASSYKSMSSESASSNAPSYPPQLSSIPSVSNIFTPVSANPTLLSLSSLPTTTSSYSSVNLPQMVQPAIRTPLVATLGAASQVIMPNGSNNVGSSSTGSGPISPSILSGGASVTAPAHSSGQYFAKNGMNPFDGLILASRDGDNTDHNPLYEE